MTESDTAGRTVVCTADLTVGHQPGNGTCDDIVISFTGIQQGLGGIQREEFAQSIKRQSILRSAFYVRDNRSTWYNSTGPAIIEAMTALTGDANVYTLGNSMGGFGAILFALALPNAKASISFCPQYSIDKAIVAFEARWGRLTDAVGQILYQTCLPKALNQPKGCCHYIFCGAEDMNDVRHAELIYQHAANPAHVFLVPGCHHDIARHLKRHGALQAVLDSVMSDPTSHTAVEAVLQQYAVSYTLWPERPGL